MSGEIAGDFDALGTKIKILAEQFGILNKTSEFFNVSKLNLSYQLLQESMAVTQEFVSQQGKIFRENIFDSFRYQVHEFESMVELQNLMKKFQKYFLNADKKLTSRKDELFKEKKVDKWKLDAQTLKVHTVESLMKNKVLAISKMLPKVRQTNRF